MSFRIIQLENLSINITKGNNNLSLSFKNAHIKKTMDDAEEKTLWTQNGSIELRNIKKISNTYNQNETILSISISYDFYTYKNIIVLPFMKKGGVDLEILFNNTKSTLDISCSEMEVLLVDNPKYIKHIKKSE
tara:strand:- start:31 stop:429 length:399 start_codon:yes stop_codon:yes gene_type:complete